VVLPDFFGARSGHLGLPTDIPEARAPPLHLVGDAPPTEAAGDQILFDEPA
jgi:hypothetical protein